MRILQKLKKYLLTDKPKSAALSLLVEIPFQIGKILRKAIAGSVLGLGLAFISANPSYSISFVFNYEYDTNGFFTDSTRRSTLEEAASYYTSFTDNLTSICVPNCDAPNTWTPQFYHPATGEYINGTVNMAVNQNTLIIYAGGRVLSGSTLGEGGPGGYTGSAISQEFFNNIKSRGQVGALNPTNPTDFGNWGGAITFTTTANWHFGGISSPPSTGQSDFLSVAVHELGHLMGFLYSPPNSWATDVSGTSFVGTNSVAVYGRNISLAPDQSHWVNGTMSTLPGTNTVQETVMDPSLTQGTRKLLTRLDYAGFRDIGWEVPASFTAIPFEFKPDTAIALVGVGAIGHKLWKRNRKARK